MNSPKFFALFNEKNLINIIPFIRMLGRKPIQFFVRSVKKCNFEQSEKLNFSYGVRKSVILSKAKNSIFRTE